MEKGALTGSFFLSKMAGVLVVLKHLNTRHFNIPFTFKFNTLPKHKVKVNERIPIPNGRVCRQL
jgi:hypothetical protein